MRDADMLLRACHAHPDDNTPRLMWADAIEEADPARAELVRLQVAMAEDGYAPIEARARRVDDLIGAHVVRWRAGRSGAGTTLTGTTQTLRWWHGDTTAAHQFVPGGSDVRVWAVSAEYERGLLVVYCPYAATYGIGAATAGLDPDNPREFSWRPSAWARRLIREHPDVAEIRVNLAPDTRSHPWGTWWAMAPTAASAFAPWEVPPPLLQYLRKQPGSFLPLVSPANVRFLVGTPETKHAAETALARAWPAWVRDDLEARPDAD